MVVCPRYTPSVNTPTVGSTDAIELLIPTPRMEKLAIAIPEMESSSATLGMLTARLSRSFTFKASIFSELKWVIAKGTF